MVVVFQHHRTSKEQQREWRLGDEVIAEMDSYKYLGVEFDKGLTFSELKARLADKARKNRTMTWNIRLTAKSWSMDPKCGVIENGNQQK